jgi:hypothetical protein
MRLTTLQYHRVWLREVSVNKNNFIGDTTEATMLLVFSATFISLFVILSLLHTFAYQKTINTIYSIDLIPITGGTKKHFAGGIVTILYVITLSIMINGVVFKYLFFN